METGLWLIYWVHWHVYCPCGLTIIAREGIVIIDINSNEIVKNEIRFYFCVRNYMTAT